jgi:hypothetical protein
VLRRLPFLFDFFCFSAMAPSPRSSKTRLVKRRPSSGKAKPSAKSNNGKPPVATRGQRNCSGSSSKQQSVTKKTIRKPESRGRATNAVARGKSSKSKASSGRDHYVSEDDPSSDDSSSSHTSQAPDDSSSSYELVPPPRKRKAPFGQASSRKKKSQIP